MDLAATYREVRKSIVAFVPRYIPLAKGQQRPEIPPIIGTGFIVDDGIVITNDHVVRALARVPRPLEVSKDESPFSVLLLHEVPGEEIAQIYFEVLGLGILREIQVEGHYYGPRRLDLAAVHIKARGLPKLVVDSEAVPLEEGRLVATAGFPMGDRCLGCSWLPASDDADASTRNHQRGPAIRDAEAACADDQRHDTRRSLWRPGFRSRSTGRSRCAVRRLE